MTKHHVYIQFVLKGKSPYSYGKVKTASLREETSKTPELLGIVRCDVKVAPNNPDLLKKFSEFTPIFFLITPLLRQKK